MLYTSVQDNVDISLAETKEWLRLTDVLVSRLSDSALVGDDTLHLTTVEFLNKGEYLTINGISYLIESVNYSLKTVVLDKELEQELERDTPVYSHPHDQLLMMLIDAAKSHADEYLNNPFPMGVPREVKLWCLKKIALDYDRPEAGISRIQFDQYASKTYGADIYEEIDHLRYFPL